MARDPITFYKGAAPGTWWAVNDAQATGGFVAPGPPSGGRPYIVSRIARASFPSPYISVTASFDVAMDYACLEATEANPGYVYPIIWSSRAFRLVDPIREISRAPHAHFHDGDQNFISWVGAMARTWKPRSPSMPGAGPRGPVTPVRPPISTVDHQALVFAVRDAEMLAQFIPVGCIQPRLAVY